MSARGRQHILDAIGLLTLRENGARNDADAQRAYLEQVYEGDVMGAGGAAMTLALAALCERLLADLAAERSSTRGEVLQELAARYVGQ